MTLAAAIRTAFKSSSILTWKSTGKLQHTLAGCIQKTGVGLHSGKITTVKIFPELATRGRYFKFNSKLIDASIDFAEPSPMCTTLCRDGHRIKAVEHLLSALEGMGVDNCRIEIENSDGDEKAAEVPILDGSAKEWVEAIESVGLRAALDQEGSSHEKMAPFFLEKFDVTKKDDRYIMAYPVYEESTPASISCEIDYHNVPDIGHQMISGLDIEDDAYVEEIAPARTFHIFEEHSITTCSWSKCANPGMLKGASEKNGIVWRTDEGWINLPLRFEDEPCRHRIVDLIGDLSLFARHGSQGLPIANILAYKSGHALHAEFVRRLKQLEQE